jgi:hypothetical protein
MPTRRDADLPNQRVAEQGDERVAVFYLDQLSVREEFGETPTVLGWHHAVCTGPDYEGGLVEAWQAFGRGKQEVGIGRCCSQHPHGVAPDLRLLQDRLHPPGGGGVSSYGQPAERDRQPADRPEPHLLHEQPEHPGRELAGQ